MVTIPPVQVLVNSKGFFWQLLKPAMYQVLLGPNGCIVLGLCTLLVLHVEH